MSVKIDLAAVAVALQTAANHAAQAGFAVEFEVQDTNQMLTVRALGAPQGGSESDIAVTALLVDPELVIKAIDEVGRRVLGQDVSTLS